MDKFVVTYEPLRIGDDVVHKIAELTFNGVHVPCTKVEVHQGVSELATIVIHSIRLEVRVRDTEESKHWIDPINSEGG